jgi:Tfp pilus assembly major pilin PilA
MEIKVNCTCGQTYAFDVEPVNNAMPCAVNCPACGADGTQLANQYIANNVIAAPPAAPGGLRINRPAVAPAPAPASTAPVAAETPAAPPQRLFTRAALGQEKAAPPSEERVLMGIVGGVAAGTIGMLIWFGLTAATGRRFGIVAWAIGGMTGYGVRALGRQGTSLLGVIAAICATLAILGGQFLSVNVQVNKFVSSMVAGAYDAKIESAKTAVQAKTDPEIKKWLAEQDDTKNESEITAQDIQSFREKDQPEMQRLLDGTPSRAQFEADLRSKLSSMSMKYSIFKTTISLFTVLFVCFGVASAYRIASS